ncbi:MULTISPECIES: hypothetical protein [unclassified Pseudonocardia]|jgi:hypothetical protein|uniref:hypothetical protein n=1 Tax=unclassified Pseudonocardia TaxID=2619320 RepID=UPI00095CA913|nr:MULTISPECIES: hypothetical protein [unclassified Pseudonocardia]MBN9097119.1 hypothetical protein [Pseudonocardia sp.]OJY42190.1 MAG: hypothetical protein BGP03_09970 [Pseudonocardia sp. 73-21]
MPPDTSFVTTHVHTDGPIPGPHSLLTVTAVAHTTDGDPIGSFTTNVRELPGATLHPASLQLWRRRAEDWLCTRRASLPPATAMSALTRWIDDLPGGTVFVTDTVEPDYLFLYWYLQRFTGRWPFDTTTAESGLYDRLTPTPQCPLTGCRSLARAS